MIFMLLKSFINETGTEQLFIVCVVALCVQFITLNGESSDSKKSEIMVSKKVCLVFV